MWQVFAKKIKLMLSDETLRKRLGFVLFGLVLFRILAAIPVPGVNQGALEQFFTNNEFLGLLDVFSGGGLANLSIVMLGVAPYITASIIMQLLTIMSPKLKALYQEEGEAGRKKFTQYSRLITVPLAIVQSIGFLALLKQQGIVPDLGMFDMITNVAVITGGSILLMWIGELITEFGIGNGVSLLIFAGIVSRLPSIINELVFTFDPTQIPTLIGFAFLGAVIVAAVVTVTEAERPIPITYAKRARGSKMYGGVSTYLPLRVNQAGVIPIIFALSLLLFPQMLFNFLEASSVTFLSSTASVVLAILENTWVYASIYFLLVFLFTYFYTAVTFDPDSISENLQKSGAFIPGVRPGKKTAQYISKVLTRITLVGAIFLGLIAVLPFAMQALPGIGGSLAIGGTALLIVVQVVLDLVKKIDAQISIREY